MPFLKSEARMLLRLGLLLPALAQAVETLPPSAEDTGTASSLSSTINAPLPDSEHIAGMGPSVPMEELDQHRGGSSVNSIRSEAISNGLLQDATASNVATGTNTIADGAFSHAIGLPIVIQNSGANVVIQNSTIVNVQFR